LERATGHYYSWKSEKLCDMSTLTSIIIVVTLLIVTTSYFIGKFIISFRKACEQASRKRFERVQALHDKLVAGQHLNQSDIYNYAENALTRDNFPAIAKHVFDRPVSAGILYH
jgi:cell division protein FtsB